MNATVPDDVELERMEAAADWCIRLHDAPADEALLATWLQWCEAQPENLAAFQQAQAVWHGALPARPQVTTIERAAAADSHRVSKRSRASFVAWAASVVLAVGAAGWISNERTRTPTTQSYATPVAGTGSSVLPDGSKVELGANSRITTHYYAAQRAITVDAGEAYFVVNKDPARPFVVRAGDVQVRALGTAFNVRRGRDRVIVGVQEGIVQIADKFALEEPVALAAGKQAVYEATSHKVAVVPIQPQDAASWRQGVLKYMHEPLAVVAADLSRYSNRPIIVNDPQLAQAPFTGTVFTSRIVDAVHAFADVFPLKVIEREDRIELIPNN